MFDLVLSGGTVVDGTGAPGSRADVGVRGESLAAIGDLRRAEARRVTDAAGLVVAPGFIDPHTHAENARLTDPQHAMGLRQGITTEFLGIDGISHTPLSPANNRGVAALAGRAARRAVRGPPHVERRRLAASDDKCPALNSMLLPVTSVVSRSRLHAHLFEIELAFDAPEHVVVDGASVAHQEHCLTLRVDHGAPDLAVLDELLLGLVSRRLIEPPDVLRPVAVRRAQLVE
jgi:hypothetical protein